MGTDQPAVSGPKCRSQIRLGGRPSRAFPNGHLEGAETFLLVAVVVQGHGIARLSASLDECTRQRIAPLPARDMQRPPSTAP